VNPLQGRGFTHLGQRNFGLADASGRLRTLRGRSDGGRVVVGDLVRWLRDEEAIVR
jgi:hypothetical protein